MRKGHKGLHPGFNVGMDLIIWLGLVGCNAGLGIIGMTSDLNDVLAPPLASSYRQGYVPAELRGAIQELARKGLVVVVFVCILTWVPFSSNFIYPFNEHYHLHGTRTFHLALFSIACYETHIRNRKPQQGPFVTQNTVAPARLISGDQVYFLVPGPPTGQTQQTYNLPEQPLPIQKQPMEIPAVPLIAYARNTVSPKR